VKDLGKLLLVESELFEFFGIDGNKEVLTLIKKICLSLNN